MLDEHSLIVSYEAWRGEPRAPAPKDRNFEGRGHCIDCKLCVQSCPTGVDIRFGNQLACIGCGLCIDACDAVMDKFGLPRGLISLDSSANQEARNAGATPPGKRIVRPRTILYMAILTIVGTVMLTALLNRSTIEVNVLHERSPLFVQLSDGGVRNGYSYKILNMIREDRTYILTTQGIDGATIDVVGGDSNATQTELEVEGDTVGTFRIFVSAPDSSLKSARQPVVFVLTEKSTGQVIRNESMFAAPDR